VDTRRPHHIGIYATPVVMLASLGVLTDGLDSPFIDLEYMVRSLPRIRSTSNITYKKETHNVTLTCVGIHV